MKTYKKILFGLIATFILASCGRERKRYIKSPIDKIITQYIDQKDYSVILLDMNYDEGSDSYFHKYRILLPQGTVNSAEDIKTVNTDWQKVSPLVFEQYQNDLGMTILSKENGTLNKKAMPSGYNNYVGNTKYGHWRTDSRGYSFWEFYGQYAFMRSLFGWGPSYYHYRNDYDYYRRNYYGTGRSYYGYRNKYGTNHYKNKSSSWTQKPKTFKDKVRSKVSRSSSALKAKGYSSNKSYGSSSKKTYRSSSRYGSGSSSYRGRSSGGFGK